MLVVGGGGEGQKSGCRNRTKAGVHFEACVTTPFNLHVAAVAEN